MQRHKFCRCLQLFSLEYFCYESCDALEIAKAAASCLLVEVSVSQFLAFSFEKASVKRAACYKPTLRFLNANCLILRFELFLGYARVRADKRDYQVACNMRRSGKRHCVRMSLFLLAPLSLPRRHLQL